MATQSKETKGDDKKIESTTQSGKELDVKKAEQAGQQGSGAVQRTRNPAAGLMQRLRRRGELANSGGDIWSASPFELMRRMADDIDRMFEDFPLMRWVDDDFGGGFPMEQRSMWSPRIDVFAQGDELVVRADLPGLKKEDLKIEVVGNNLVVEGERKHEHEEKREGYYRSEREYGQFRRVIPLPEGANLDDAKATFDNGVLEVKVKQPKRESRRIEIGAGAKPAETTATATAGGEEAPKVH